MRGVVRFAALALLALLGLAACEPEPEDVDDYRVVTSEIRVGSGSLSECSDAVAETLTIAGASLAVARRHCIDRIGPAAEDVDVEGPNYEYDTWQLSLVDATVVARGYAGEPREAHFLRIEIGGAARALESADFARPVLRAAIAYLRSIGRTELEWLDASSEDGFSAIP